MLSHAYVWGKHEVAAEVRFRGVDRPLYRIAWMPYHAVLQCGSRRQQQKNIPPSMQYIVLTSIQHTNSLELQFCYLITFSICDDTSGPPRSFGGSLAKSR